MINANPKPSGVKVPKRNILAIRQIASNTRRLFDVHDPYADAINILEFKLPQYGVTYDICDKSELGDDHGLTIPDQGIIKIREDVYCGACEGNGRDRFTIFHEIGHLIMHSGVPLARTQNSSNDHKWVEDSEWQANTYAAEFMMPVEHIKALCKTPNDVSRQFGASFDASVMRLNKLRKQKIIK